MMTAQEIQFESRMKKIKAEWRQADWNRDIDSYTRWKNLNEKTPSEFAKQMMERIKARWPDHQKLFD